MHSPETPSSGFVLGIFHSGFGIDCTHLQLIPSACVTSISFAMLSSRARVDSNPLIRCYPHQSDIPDLVSHEDR